MRYVKSRKIRNIPHGWVMTPRMTKASVELFELASKALPALPPQHSAISHMGSFFVYLVMAVFPACEQLVPHDTLYPVTINHGMRVLARMTPLRSAGTWDAFSNGIWQMRSGSHMYRCEDLFRSNWNCNTFLLLPSGTGLIRYLLFILALKLIIWLISLRLIFFESLTMSFLAKFSRWEVITWLYDFINFSSAKLE